MSNVKISLGFFELVKVIICKTSVVVVNCTFWIVLDSFLIIVESFFKFFILKV